MFVGSRTDERQKSDGEIFLAQVNPRSGSVTVAGATLRFVAEGTGLPVLVVGSATYYPRTFSRRLRADCTLAFTDLRHFAPSDAAFDLNRITFDTYADDIDRVRAALGFERCVIAGHSKHGNIALEYAKRYPARASHVVLIGSPPCGLERVVGARDDFWESHASEARRAALRLNWDALTPSRLAAMSPAEAEVARYVADGPRYWYDPAYDASPLWQGMYVNAGVLDKLHGLFEGYELSWNPTRFRSPVLVAAGRYDFAVPHVLWDEQRPRLQNVTYQLFERSGHTPQLEEQELFDRTLLGWLRQGSVAAVK